MTLKLLQGGLTHHAYLIEGELAVLLPELITFLETDYSIKIRGNPDVWIGTYGTFGINNARALRELHSKKAFGEKKLFIVSCDSITREAQNALLKMFEEPTAHTHFFIIVPSTEILLSTLKSRLAFVNPVYGKRTAVQESRERADAFLNADVAKRLVLIKDIVEEKDTPDALKLLDELETLLHERFVKDQTDMSVVHVLEEIALSRSYLRDRAPSVKGILEHIALVTPLA